ncbi:MAG: hypothetical protein AB1633_09430, partial [Elusimicrobiota bacterium]
KAMKLKHDYEQARRYIEVIQEISNYKDCLKKSLEESDGKADGWYFEIANAFHDLEEYYLAERYYLLTIKINPQNKFVYTNLGALYTCIGKNELALEYFQTALKNNPADTLALLNIGGIYEKLKVVDSAFFYMKRVFELSGKGPKFLMEYALFLEKAACEPREINKILTMLINSIEGLGNPKELRYLAKEAVIKKRALEVFALEIKALNSILKKSAKLCKKGDGSALGQYIDEEFYTPPKDQIPKAHAIKLLLGFLSKESDFGKGNFLKSGNFSLIGNQEALSFAKAMCKNGDIIFYLRDKGVLIFKYKDKNWKMTGFAEI